MIPSSNPRPSRGIPFVLYTYGLVNGKSASRQISLHRYKHSLACKLHHDGCNDCRCLTGIASSTVPTRFKMAIAVCLKKLRTIIPLLRRHPQIHRLLYRGFSFQTRWGVPCGWKTDFCPFDTAIAHTARPYSAEPPKDCLPSNPGTSPGSQPRSVAVHGYRQDHRASARCLPSSRLRSERSNVSKFPP